MDVSTHHPPAALGCVRGELLCSGLGVAAEGPPMAQPHQSFPLLFIFVFPEFPS